MKKSYTIAYDLHALHERVQKNERKKQIEIDQLHASQVELSQQQQLLSQLDQGHHLLFKRFELEEASYDPSDLDGDALLEEKAYMDEMQDLVHQAEQQMKVVHLAINQCHQIIKKRICSIDELESNIDQSQQDIITLQEQEDHSVDIKSVLKAEILPPLYKTLEIFSTVKDLGSELKALYKRKSEKGHQLTFIMATLGFLLVFSAFVYLLVDTRSQLSLTWWLSLSVIISCAFIFGGMWAKWKVSAIGMIASLSIFVGCLMLYSSLWLLLIKGEGLSIGIIFSIFIVLNALVYTYAYIYRVKALFFLSFSFSLCLVLYTTHSTHWLSSVLYLWLLTAVSLYLAQRLSWFSSVYALFAISMAALSYLLLPVQQVSVDMGALMYLVVVQSFFVLYLCTFLYLLGSGKSRLSELFLLMTLFGFGSFVYFNVDESFLLMFFSANAILLLISGFIMWYGLRRESQSVTLWMMSAFLCMGVIHVIGGIWSPVFWGVEASSILLLSFLLKMRVLRQASYLLMLIAFVGLLYSMCSALWFDFHLLSSFSNVWIYLLCMGLFAKFILVLFSLFSQDSNGRDKLIAHFLSAALSLWLLLIGAYSAYVLLPDAWMLMALPLSVLLLIRALHLKSIATELMAFFLMASLPIQLFYDVYQQKNTTFYSLSWDMQTIWFGLLALLFLLPYLYRHYAVTGLRARMIDPMLQTFYILLPTFWLVDVFFLAPKWFGAALWCAALLMFIIHLWQRQRVYFMVNVILTCLAAVGSLLIYYQALFSFPDNDRFLALINGPLYFLILFLVVKVKLLRHAHHAYHHLVLAGFYFSLLSLLLWSLSWSSGWMLGCLLVQGITFLVSWRSPGYRLLQGQLPTLYVVTMLMPIPMLYMTYAADSLLYAFLMGLSVLMAMVLVHGRHGRFNKIWEDLPLYQCLLLIAHLCFLMMYVVLLHLWLNDWLSSTLTFVWLLHLAVLFVLSNMKAHYHILLSATIPFCVLIAVKALFDDFKNGSTLERLLVLLVFGFILILGAYFMQRQRQKKDETSHI